MAGINATHLIAAGGTSGSNRVGHVYILDTVSEIWTQVPSMEVPR